MLRLAAPDMTALLDERYPASCWIASDDKGELMALTDINVLDLTIARAGPTAVRQLADWGASVFRVEAPSTGAKTIHGPCAPASAAVFVWHTPWWRRLLWPVALA